MPSYIDNREPSQCDDCGSKTGCSCWMSRDSFWDVEHILGVRRIEECQRAACSRPAMRDSMLCREHQRERDQRPRF
jgi:hypothetical protein